MPDPAIKHENGGVGERGKGGNAMVSIEDAIRAAIKHEHSRGRDTTVLRAELAELEKAHPSIADSTQRIGLSVEVTAAQAAYDALRIWEETNLREGKITPMPQEVSDRFERLMIEHVGPLGSEGGGVDGCERPADSPDDRDDIHVEDRGGHVDHDLSGNG